MISARNYLTKIAFAVLFTIVLTTPGSAKILQMGVVMDGKTHVMTELIDSIKDEISKLISDDTSVLIKESCIKDGQWNQKLIKKEIDSLMADKSVNAVIALGPVASHLGSHQLKYSKPFFCSSYY